jgi:nucleoside 2-deoxyribosyltransferase
MPVVYLAGPLFSRAERDFARAVKARILEATRYEVIWPYELFTQEEIAEFGKDAPFEVMRRCRDALEGCALVVAMLDGPQTDDGTAWEMGYAHARGIPAVGIRTDFRQAGDVPGAKVNAMIHGSCRFIASTLDELVEKLAARP